MIYKEHSLINIINRNALIKNNADKDSRTQSSLLVLLRLAKLQAP